MPPIVPSPPDEPDILDVDSDGDPLEDNAEGTVDEEEEMDIAGALQEAVDRFEDEETGLSEREGRLNALACAAASLDVLKRVEM